MFAFCPAIVHCPTAVDRKRSVLHEITSCEMTVFLPTADVRLRRVDNTITVECVLMGACSCVFALCVRERERVREKEKTMHNFAELPRLNQNIAALPGVLLKSASQQWLYAPPSQTGPSERRRRIPTGREEDGSERRFMDDCTCPLPSRPPSAGVLDAVIVDFSDPVPPSGPGRRSKFGWPRPSGVASGFWWIAEETFPTVRRRRAHGQTERRNEAAELSRSRRIFSFARDGKIGAGEAMPGRDGTIEENGERESSETA